MRRGQEAPPLILSTTPTLPGYRILRHVGLVVGTSQEWTEAVQACWEAIDDMVSRATQIGAHAIVDLRLNMTAAGESAYVTAVAYGSAVQVELLPPGESPG